MKKNLLLISLITATFVGKGQNLVSNGDFELHTGCPSGVAQLNLSQFWTNPAGYSPDYYHECGSNGVNPPYCTFGYQYPRNDSAMGGIAIWYSGGPLREYIQTPLTSQLSAGVCYHFEMYVNFANNNQYATDAIGAYFSDTALTGLLNLFAYTPQINNTTGFITDTLNWTLVSGNYTATGNENYLIIGNFKDDATTNTMLANANGTITFSYYYIDDVSLTPCTTGIEEQHENTALNIYPNPAKDLLYIKSNSLSGKEEIKITDVSGRKVLQQIINNQSSIINIKSFNAGIYFIEITNEKNIYIRKFIKENVKQ